MLSLLSIPVAFKEIFTNTTHDIHVNPNWSITQFMIIIKPCISKKFNIPINNIEIIEAGQYNYIMPESAPSLTNADTKLKDKWSEKLNVSFYVRNKNHIYPQLTINPLRNTHLAPIIGDCPICFDMVETFLCYNCSHRICNQCYNNCRRRNYNICPICRQN